LPGAHAGDGGAAGGRGGVLWGAAIGVGVGGGDGEEGHDCRFLVVVIGGVSYLVDCRWFGGSVVATAACGSDCVGLGFFWLLLLEAGMNLVLKL